MIRLVSFYLVVCDRKGEKLNTGLHTRDFVAPHARSLGWHVQGGNHLCPECTPEPPDDLARFIDHAVTTIPGFAEDLAEARAEDRESRRG